MFARLNPSKRIPEPHERISERGIGGCWCVHEFITNPEVSRIKAPPGSMTAIGFFTTSHQSAHEVFA